MCCGLTDRCNGSGFAPPLIGPTVRQTMSSQFHGYGTAFLSATSTPPAFLPAKGSAHNSPRTSLDRLLALQYSSFQERRMVRSYALKRCCEMAVENVVPYPESIVACSSVPCGTPVLNTAPRHERETASTKPRVNHDTEGRSRPTCMARQALFGRQSQSTREITSAAKAVKLARSQHTKSSAPNTNRRWLCRDRVPQLPRPESSL